MSKKPICLISNDDGVEALGIKKLAEMVSDFSKVYIVAPDRERSASSQALTITGSLNHKKLDSQAYSDDIYSLDGTPVDCVRYGINHLLPHKPSLVITGINRGGNLGTDIFYSGTVGAAMEGARYGCPAMAISCFGNEICERDYRTSAQVVRKILERSDSLLYADCVLNINVPALPYKNIKGIKNCHTADWSLYSSCHNNNIAKRKTNDQILDCQEIMEGYVTVSALKSDLFDKQISSCISEKLPSL